MLISVKRTAEILGVSPSLVYSMVAKGTLPAVRIGNGRGTIRIEEEDVRRLLEASRTKPPAEYELKHLSLSG